jgi:Fic-DOC domain mobile mystery protein B
MTSEPDGTTALDPDEAAELIPEHLATRADLNAWEQANIAKAADWLAGRRRPGPVASVDFVRELHARMFGATWKWAGSFRKTAKNIGVPAHAIPEQVHNLLNDVRYWIEHKTYNQDEIAARFHHRLVQIHAFPNGNGRHARLMTDELLREQGSKPFTWGSGSIDNEGDVRTRYLEALRRADRGDFRPLFNFVRSGEGH